MPESASAVQLSDATRLAIDRTRLAYERTLMAWVRTATSLITFGFTIYKFFMYMTERGNATPATGFFGPRSFAILMISVGLTALLLAAVQHRQHLQLLRAEYGGAGARVPYSIATVVAALISGLGILSLLAVVFGQ
jgi:putative membrane protein